MVKLYSLHKNTNKSDTVTLEKLLLFMDVLLSSGATLILTLCALEIAKIKLDKVTLVMLISVWACSVNPGFFNASEFNCALIFSIRGSKFWE